ncbi:MAG: hypothetical protein AAGG11_14140 [Pseudomonadota bacterium]
MVANWLQWGLHPAGEAAAQEALSKRDFCNGQPGIDVSNTITRHPTVTAATMASLQAIAALGYDRIVYMMPARWGPRPGTVRVHPAGRAASGRQHLRIGETA